MRTTTLPRHWKKSRIVSSDEEKDIFPPLFIESKRGDDLSSKKTDFSRKICTLGRKVLREDIFEEGEKGRMIMGSEENERILIRLGIWSWNGESISF